MNSLEKAAQAVLVRWDSPAWDWAHQGPTAALMADLREALAAHKQAEPVVDRERPIGWLYPEGLEALRAGKPWTIYGTKQDHSNAPVYGAVAQKVEPHESESVEGSIPSLRHQRLESWKTQQAEPVRYWQWACSVCGLGADGKVMGYACPRGDCPTQVRSGTHGRS